MSPFVGALGHCVPWLGFQEDFLSSHLRDSGPGLSGVLNGVL